MRGIDVSENNGTIDWNKVKQDNIDFAIIRVGWIGNNNNHTIDKNFEEYYNGAKNAGLKIGFYVYSYAYTENSYETGANWCLNLIKEKTYDLPFYLDLEDSSIEHLDKETLTNYAIKFCDILKNNNVTSGVYANKSWFTNHLDINRLLQYSIWLAEWRDDHHTADFRVDMWQYSDNGNVNGISGRVDMNIWYGSSPEPPKPDKNKAWKKWFYSKNFKININA